MNCPLCQSANSADSRRCRACGAALKATASENSAAHLPDALPTGALLIGTYAVEGVLGQGGFGITYNCHDQMLDRHVAIKEFFPSGCRRENADVQPARGLSETDYRAARTQFLAEARVLARCHHAGIVSVHTAFEANQTAYMVMELLSGKTLAQLLSARGGRMKEAESVTIIERVGDALGFVHDLDLLHRDIKPDNIIVCDDGRVMLIDFGTAREFVKGQAQGQTVVVTPGYAPLEQYAKQARRGAFTDIYSLAATLYHLLTGQMPPSASDRAMGVQLRPVREFNPNVGASVAFATENGLQMEIAKRPQSVSEFLDLLHAPVAQVEAQAPFHSQLADLSPDDDFDEDADSDANMLPPMLTPDALRARQKGWRNALPNANTRPVQIAPQSVFAPPAPLNAPTPPSSYNSSSGRIQVKPTATSDNSLTLVWWIFGIIVGIFALGGLFGNRSSPTPTPQPSNYSFPSNPPANTNFTSTSPDDPREKTEAQRAWDALSVISPISVKELPTTKSAAASVSYPTAGSGIAFSPDGKRLAYIDGQAVLRVLRLPGREVVRSLQLDKKYTPINVMFSPDNATIAVTRSRKTQEVGVSVDIWDLRTGNRAGILDENSAKDPFVSVTLLNDRRLSLRNLSSTNGDVQVENVQIASWNPQTGKISATQSSLPNTADMTYDVVSPDGKTLVVGDSRGVLRWLDLKTKNQVAQYSTTLTEGEYEKDFGRVYSGAVNSALPVAGIDYALNGKYLASRNQGEITVFDSKSEAIGSLRIDATSMFFSISPDGQWLAARGSLPYVSEGTLLYNLKTKEKIRLKTPYDTMRDFGFSPDGKQLYGIFSDGAKLQFATWNVDAKANVNAAKTSRLFASISETPFTSQVSSSSPIVALAQSTKEIAVANDNDIQMREKNGDYVNTLTAFATSATRLSPNGKMLVARTKSGIELWNVPDKQKVSQLDEIQSAAPSGSNSVKDGKDARSMAFSPNNNLLAYVRTSGDADVVELWSVDGSARRLASLTQKEAVNVLVFAPDSGSLICGGDNGLLQWIDIETRKTESQLQTGAPIFDIAYAARNLLVMGGANSAVYDISTKSADPLQKAGVTKLPRFFNSSPNFYTPSAISPDGKLFAQAQGYYTIQIWELPSGKPLQVLSNQLDSESVPALALSFSGDSTELTALRGQSGRQQMAVTVYRRAKAE